MTLPAAPEPAPVVLIACCKRKIPRPAPARLLYRSPLFVLSLAYAELMGPFWRATGTYVVSAEHGLVTLDSVLRPYDLTLADRPAPARRAWGHDVSRQLHARHPERPPVIFLAGDTYRRAVGPYVRRYAVPMLGLGIGQQLAWLRRELDARRCRACGCTDHDCRGCIERTGRPCSWVAADLCSGCEGAPVASRAAA